MTTPASSPPTCSVPSAVVIGVEGRPVVITVSLESLLPSITIVGLPLAAVREARERVRSAIQAAGLTFPRKRINVTISPADIPKRGTQLDLPIALAVLGAAAGLESLPFAIGELGLDGSVRCVRGVFPLCEAAPAGVKVLVPALDDTQAHAAVGDRASPVCTLEEAWLVATSPTARGGYAHPIEAAVEPMLPDLCDIRGLAAGRRALEIAAAGGHSLALVGPAGSGKSMLARRLASILPPMSEAERIEVLRIRSAAGLLAGCAGLPVDRPFRAPHHTSSIAAVLGGGIALFPGEVTLAHRGVLLLDDAPEFPRSAMDGLREVLERKQVAIVRTEATIRLPADFQLVVTATPCPCGQGPRACVCNSRDIERYKTRVPPTDMEVWIDQPSAVELLTSPPGESSEVVRGRVVAARERLNAGITCPAEWVSSVASTIAALDGKDHVEQQHTDEARSLTGDK